MYLLLVPPPSLVLILHELDFQVGLVFVLHNINLHIRLVGLLDAEDLLRLSSNSRNNEQYQQNHNIQPAHGSVLFMFGHRHPAVV
jgi:hypothetical protein